MLKLGIRRICWLVTETVIDFSVAIGLITIVAEVLGQRKEILPLRHIAKPRSQTMDACSARTKPHHKTSPGRVAQRRLGMRIGEERSPSG